MKRNYGIEIGRIITMVMVMVLHILGQGGILSRLGLATVSGQVAVLLEYLSIVAVNVFGLITGYVMINGHWRFQKILKLWIQVITTSWLVLACLFFFIDISIKDALSMIFPTLFNQYWYFNSYLVLFVLIPILNKGIKGLSKREFEKVLYVIFFLFCLVSSLAKANSLYLDRGYTPVWLMYLYLVGAYINLYGEKFVNKFKYLKIYLGMAGITLLLHDILNFAKMFVLHTSQQSWAIRRYTFPTIAIMSIALFLFLININVSEKYYSIIDKFSKHAFSAYLIQTNVLVYQFILADAFANVVHLNLVVMILIVIISAVITFIVATVIDFIREFVVSVLRIEKMVDYLFSKISSLAIISTKYFYK